MLSDYGSVTKQNLNLISKESCIDTILEVSPSYVVSSMVYSPIPVGEEWRESFLKELLDLRKHHLELEWEDNVSFTYDELTDMIRLVATS